jgi:Leucine-rich repeat (LRR) protein
MRGSFILLTVALAGCSSRPQAKSPVLTQSLDVTPENASVLQDLSKYPDLRVLSISCLDKLPVVPDSIGNLAKLEELKIDNGNGCVMNPVLPESLGRLHSLKKLVLYGAQDATTEGDQPHQRHPFPHSLSELKNLTYLDLGRNSLDEVPSFVKDLPKLQELHFSSNAELKELPSFLASLQELEKIELVSDGLTDLPDFLNTLPRLSRVLLGDNCKITQSEGKMKDLRRRFPKVDFDFTDEFDCPSK